MKDQKTLRIFIKKLLFSGFLSLSFFFSIVTPASAFDFNLNARNVWEFYITEIVQPMNDGLQTVISLLLDKNTFQIVLPETPSKTVSTSTTSLPTPVEIPAPLIVVGNQPNVIYREGIVGPRGPQGIQGPAGPKGSSGGSSSSNLDTSSFVSRTLFDNQVNAILTSIENGLSNLSDSIAKGLNTITLAVSGSASVGGNLTVTGTITGGTINGTVNPALTLGSVFFQGATGLAEDNANLFWDDTNNRLGIGLTVPTAVLHLKAGTAALNTAPLKFTSGTLLTAPEAGAIEFLTDAFYGTITTGAERKQFAFTSDLTSGYVPYTGANADVDLGSYGITTSNANVRQTLWADKYLESSNSQYNPAENALNGRSDGSTWTEAGTDALSVETRELSSVVYDGKMWVIGGRSVGGGYSRKVYYSTNGSTWTEAGTDALPVATALHSSLVYDGKMWVIGGRAGGYTRKVYYSTNGSTWTEAGTDALPVGTDLHSSVVYDGKMWVLGGDTESGYTRKVYYSTNGSTWTEAGTDALPAGNIWHSSVVYDGKMWFIGGWAPDLTRKVYYSTNGSTWTEAGTDALPVATAEHSSVVYDGKMWVLGGWTGGYGNSKVYYSTNGSTWTEAADVGVLSAATHSSLVYDGKMWVIGGDNSSKVYYSIPTTRGGFAVSNSIGSELFRVSNAGNVGVGIATPTSRLHVFAPAQASTNIPVDVLTVEIGAPTSGTKLGYGPAILFKDAGGADVDSLAKIAGVYELSGANYAGALAFYTNADISAADTLPTEKIRINNLGNLGVGTINPASHLQVDGDMSTDNAWTTNGIAFDVNAATYTDTISEATIAVRTANSFGAPTFASNEVITITDAFTLYVTKPIAGTNTTITRANSAYFEGNVGIGTTTPTYALDVLATGTGVIARFNSANATGCTLADGGTITCTSDERMKKNIEDITYGLDTIKGLRPVLFNWKYEDDSTSKNLGFIAQEVEALIPKLIATDENGMKSLNTTAMVPILTKAIQEMDLKITEISDLEKPNTWRDSLVAWFANMGNGITSIFANTFRASEQLCINDTCVTEAELQTLLQNAGMNTEPEPTPTPEPTPEPEPTPTPEPTPEPTGDPAPVPEPDPIVEPTPEPQPEADQPPAETLPTEVGTPTTEVGAEPTPEPDPITTPTPPDLPLSGEETTEVPPDKGDEGGLISEDIIETPEPTPEPTQ